jgi:NADH-quinone oxidoreductase subunit C
MTNQQVVEDIQQNFGAAILAVSEPYGMLEVEASVDRVHDLLEYLKEHADFQYIFLTDLCGLHYPDHKDKELGVVYHLHSWVNNHRIRIKTFFPIDKPIIPTVTDLWHTANWMERETYDFFGIIFTGHPNLKRILNMDDMDYFPLRKEYPLEDQTRQDKEDQFFGR